jgi:hypothetical protein
MQTPNKMEKIPKINRKLFGEYLDIKDLRSRVYNFLIKNYSSSGVVNHHTSFLVGFNSTSFRKLVSGNPGELKLLSISAIKEIIETGRLIEIQPDNKKRREILAVYKFRSMILDRGFVYEYYFTVRQTLSGKFIYSGHIDINKKTL